MPSPEKVYKSSNFEGSIWKNEKDLGGGGIVEFKTVTIRKTWRDNQNILREQRLNIRKSDVERVMVILKKIQEYLLLEEEK
tara:strand:- start:139 stop:381 length:243 start_codon:yes stop_codon:yes gene_type:complete